MTPAFDDTVLRIEDDRVVLIGGHCSSCRRRHFPVAPVCPACGAAVAAEPLPTVGVVEATTFTSLPVLGATPPVSVVLVRLDPDVTVQGVATDSMDRGEAARVVSRAVAGPWGELMAYGFERASIDA